MLKPIFLLFVMTMSVTIDSQKYVTVKVKNNPINVADGKSFLFYVDIKPVEGIHINAQPPISMKLLDHGTTMVVKKIPQSGEYLDLSKPVEIEGNISDLDAGEHKVNFVVSYTYCSEKEKWCRMGKDTVSITLNVKK